MDISPDSGFNMETGSSSLSSLRDHLATATPDIARQAFEILDLNDLFNHLQTSDKEQVATACEVLELCFSKLSVDYVASKVTDNLLKSLQHQSPTVRLMAVNEVHRQIKTNKNLFPLPDHLSIAIMVTKCICDQELKIAVKAMEVVSLKDWLQHPQIVNEFKQLLNNNDASNRCKCYEVVLSIAKENTNRLKDEEIQNLIHKLIGELKTDDVLMQLNVVELLSNLAIVPQGLDFLIENDVLKLLSEMVRDLEGNPLANLVIPGLMRFFGTIAHKYPTEIYNNYPVVVNAMFDAINENNPSTLPTALDTLGYVGATVEGKFALGSLGRVYISSLKNIGNLIKNSSTEIRVRALNCVEYLIDVRKDDENESQIDQRVTLMTREWFRELSDKPSSMELIFNLCKNPFPELRINALKVLVATCQHKWGEELVKSTSGLVEFLLDRSVEHEKESKHIKYDLITILSSTDIFDTNTLLRFKAYVKEGPFFVQGIAEVAVEGDE